jgi:hypothetical protein
MGFYNDSSTHWAMVMVALNPISIPDVPQASINNGSININNGKLIIN